MTANPPRSTPGRAVSGPSKALLATISTHPAVGPRPKQKKGLRASINAFCRYCLYDPSPGEGTAAAQIRACASRDCPLWAVRPGAKAAL